MNLDRLRLFLKIVDTGSVSAAGREAHLTQPAVSRSLKMLEDEVGAELFDREGRRFALTAAGRALVPSARHLVKDAERAKIQVQRAASATYYDLRVGAVDSIGVHALPAALRELAHAHEDLRIKLWMGRTQELLDRVERGTLDVAFVAYSGPPSERATRVGTYALKYFGRKDRFPELSSVASELEVQKLPMVEMQALPGQPSLIRPDADTFAVVQNLGAVKALVLAGLGVGQLLEFMLTSDERSQLLVAEGIYHDPECGVYCVRAQRELSAAEEQMIEALSRAVSERLRVAS